MEEQERQLKVHLLTNLVCGGESKSLLDALQYLGEIGFNIKDKRQEMTGSALLFLSSTALALDNGLVRTPWMG